ncbi:bifunctional Delta(1)-pyrroline-2-carboxylate/Delta(1)-piperideine-2-carboxylate reductase [Flavisphingomonas formosensis]|uniref:ornithine cyclodeaminase family protein n=1 Tax=Flavisphingomonas formosensis TaxID=861534 RepID=UPI0012F970D2|nr:ornithine cyclodeaminase family protein [Sphingomonas formosensis]
MVADLFVVPENEDRPIAPPYIDAAAIRRLVRMPALIEALKQGFTAGFDVPQRQAHALPGGATLLLMPAWDDGRSSGVKLVTVQPAAQPAVQSLYLLLDGHDGRPRAILDGTMLTPLRTAAASAVASSLLARPDSRRLLMIGTGTLAPHLIEAHCCVRPIDRIAVWGRSPDKAKALVERLIAEGRNAAIVENLDAAVANADIISAATLSQQPLIRGALVQPGTHIDLVGAFTPDMAEGDPACFARARVFVDARDAALEEAGDLLQAIAAGTMTGDAICGDLAELCSGRAVGRENTAADITLFKSVGIANEDLIAAGLVYTAWCDATFTPRPVR